MRFLFGQKSLGENNSPFIRKYYLWDLFFFIFYEWMKSQISDNNTFSESTDDAF